MSTTGCVFIVDPPFSVPQSGSGLRPLRMSTTSSLFGMTRRPVPYDQGAPGGRQAALHSALRFGPGDPLGPRIDGEPDLPGQEMLHR
jgi:hypothetical protein